MPQSAFIIRPFGVKEGIDFDYVERKLIGRALSLLGIKGRTTIEILRAGNIREDMFQRLLTADLVVADLSIHNANVFYELGLRHAFSDKYTFLLRSESSSYPFDLQTDRYFVYDNKDPAASLDKLVEALKQTLNSDQEDSPVFKLIPNLKAQDRGRFLEPPRDFREAVERAKRGEKPGDLRLLAVEVEGFMWEAEGLREIGRAQADLNYHWGARATWESLRRRYPDDLEANMMLTRIYRRLSEPAYETKSDLALRRAFGRSGLERNQRSEMLALRGYQHKDAWKKDWGRMAELPARQQKALKSPYLRWAYEAYVDAFNDNLNNYNAGLNALTLLKLEEGLKQQHLAFWDSLFDSPEAERKARAKRIDLLTRAVELSLGAERKRLAREGGGQRDFWLELNEASFYCLTSQNEVRVEVEYEEALTLSPPSSITAMREVLDFFTQLGLSSANVETALRVLQAKDYLPPELDKQKRILLFAGHRVDPPGRPEPRFPSAQAEAAKEAIKNVIKAEAKPGVTVYGMASGANGGDLLFHQACHELGVPTELYLAVAPEPFVRRYVASPDGNYDWVERFHQVSESEFVKAHVVLEDEDEMPRWLQTKPGYNARLRNNLWLLQQALVKRIIEGAQLTLIALWDGEDDGLVGGVDDLVKQASANGIRVVTLLTGKVFSAKGE